MSSSEHAVFRLVTYNVQCGIGEDKVYDPSRVGKWLSEQPVLDVVCCQEIELNDEGQAPHQSVRMGVMHNDNQPKVLADALGWSTGQHFVVKKLMRREQVNGTAPLETGQGTATSQISLIREAVMNKNLSSQDKWIDGEPAVDEKFGWGCAIMTRHEVLQRDTIRIPAQNSTFSSVLGSSRRGLSQAAGMKIKHSLHFGNTYIVSLHCMADVLGFAIDGTAGSLQLQNVRRVLQYLDSNIHEEDTDNVLVVGDFNSIAGSGVVREMHSYQGKWGPYVDCARLCGSTARTIPKFCGLRVDYVFLASKSKYLRPISASVANIGYSDHFPVTVSFGLPKTPGSHVDEMRSVASSQLSLARFHRACFIVFLGPVVLALLPIVVVFFMFHKCFTLMMKC